MGADFVGDEIQVFHAIEFAVGIGSDPNAGINGNEVIAVVDVAFDYEAVEAGFEPVSGDAGRREVPVCREVEVRGIRFALDGEWNRDAIDSEAELIVDVGEGELVTAGLVDAAGASGNRFGLWRKHRTR